MRPFRTRCGHGSISRRLSQYWRYDIVTTTANELVGPFHDRMPVILPTSTHDLWLDPEVDEAEALLPLLAPFPAAEMKAETVSSVINNARNDVDPRT